MRKIYIISYILVNTTNVNKLGQVFANDHFMPVENIREAAQSVLQARNLSSDILIYGKIPL